MDTILSILREGLQKGSRWLENFFATWFPWDQKEMKGIWW